MLMLWSVLDDNDCLEVTSEGKNILMEDRQNPTNMWELNREDILNLKEFIDDHIKNNW